MAKKITLIEGDGIGPEIVSSVKEIFLAANVPVEWEEENAGQTTLQSKGELIPKSLVNSLEKNKVALKGPITTPVGGGFKSVNVQLRQKFELYSNVRPCKSIPGLKTRYENVDLIIFRENTEGLYSGLETYDERLEIADSINRISKIGCERIIRAAFEYAKKFNRKKVTLVHKANIIKMAGALMLNAGEKFSKEYPDIKLENIIIDNLCMQLVTKPEKFDILVATNLFGDILSDLCAGLVGGLGVVPGANIGSGIAIFEAVHGSAPDIAGKGIANPTGLLKSALLMLEHIGETKLCQKIETALNLTLGDKNLCTADLGGPANTIKFTQNIISNLK